jgi:hypothetical protein
MPFPPPILTCGKIYCITQIVNVNCMSWHSFRETLVLFKGDVCTAPAESFLSITTVIAIRHWVGTVRGSKSGELT